MNRTTAFIWKQTPFLRLLLPFLAGIILYYKTGLYTSLERPAALFLFVFACLVYFLLFVINRRPKQNTIPDIAVFVSIQAAFFCFALYLCALHDITKDSRWFGHRLDKTLASVVVLSKPPAEKEKTWLYEVKVIAGIMKDSSVQTTTGKALVYVYKDSTPGARQVYQQDTLLIANSWEAVKNNGNPYEPDYARFLAYRNIYYRQFVPANRIQLAAKNRQTLPFWDRCHAWSMQQLEKHIEDKNVLGLLQAMLLGDEMHLDNEVRSAYSATGIVHIISISGSHVATLFLFVNVLFFWLKSRRWQWIKLLMAILCAWFYVLVAGAPAPALRAALMFSLLALGLVLNRNNQPVNNLWIAAFFILCIRPAWLFNIGFQLSFLAVLSLFIFYKPILRCLSPGNKILQVLWQAIAASLAVELLIFPLVIYYFYSFPVLFVVANLLAWLAMGVVMVLGFIILLCSGITESITVFAGNIVEAIVQMFHKLIFHLQAWSPAYYGRLYFDEWDLILVYALVISTSICFLYRMKWGVWATMILAIIVFSNFSYYKWNMLQEKRFVAFNVKGTYKALYSGNKKYAFAHKSSTSQINWLEKPLEARWKINQTGRDNNRAPYFELQQQKILILDSSIYYNSITNEVDVLIIDNKIDTMLLRQSLDLYKPRQVILGADLKWSYLQSAKDILNKRSVHYVCLNENNAFVVKE